MTLTHKGGLTSATLKYERKINRDFFCYNVQNTKFNTTIFIDVTCEKSEHIFMYTICINTGVKRNRLCKYCRVHWSYIVPLIINGHIYNRGSLRRLRRPRRLRQLVLIREIRWTHQTSDELNVTS